MFYTLGVNLSKKYLRLRPCFANTKRPPPPPKVLGLWIKHKKTKYTLNFIQPIFLFLVRK